MRKPSLRLRIALFASTISLLGLMLGSVALASPSLSTSTGFVGQILPPLPTTLLPPLPTTLLPPLPTTLLPPLPTTLLPPIETTLLPPIVTTTIAAPITTTTVQVTTTTLRATTTTAPPATTAAPVVATTTPGGGSPATTSTSTSTVTSTTATTTPPPVVGSSSGPTGTGSEGGTSDGVGVEFAGTFLALGPDVNDRDRVFEFGRIPSIARLDTATLALGWLFDRDASGLAAIAFSPFLALLTIWDAIRSAGSGLVAPSAGLAAVVIGAIVDHKSLILRFRRTA